MCDTLAATPAVTAAGAMLFAKNSDRERNEAQQLEMSPRRRRTAPTERLTYIEVEAAAETHASLLCRPFWMWGARWAPTSTASSSATRRCTRSSRRSASRR